MATRLRCSEEPTFVVSDIDRNVAFIVRLVKDSELVFTSSDHRLALQLPFTVHLVNFVEAA